MNNDKSWNFLETVVRSHQNKITIEPFRKNALMIQNEQRQSIFTIQHYSSYSSRRTKSAVIIATLHRLDANSMKLESLSNAVHQLSVELVLLGYPRSCLKEALTYMSQKYKDNKWIHIRLSLNA